MNFELFKNSKNLNKKSEKCELFIENNDDLSKQLVNQDKNCNKGNVNLESEDEFVLQERSLN